MTERIIDISERPARLSVRLEQLVMELGDERETATVPLDEVAALIASHPCVLFTQAMVAGLTSKGGMMVICDEKHMPVGMMLPLQANYVQAERFVKQAALGLPARKRLWQAIVRAKIRAQANLLAECGQTDTALRRLAEQVKSGDPQNIEAQAARIYWPLLFRDPEFRRRREGQDQNRLLNYGYAVLRAAVARAVCAAGLHPSFSIHHHNRYDAFALADDLMEPFRPLIDRAVAVWSSQNDPRADVRREAKAAVMAPVMASYEVEGEVRSLFDVLARVASSLARVVTGDQPRLWLPEVKAHGQAASTI